jgi:succinate dehydrogenase / fumarate reductase flavoprotein subunit
LGGNSLSDLLVFGKRAGEHAASYVDGLPARPKANPAHVEAARQMALAPFASGSGDNAYQLQHELQEIMGDLVGIIRRGGELESAIKKLSELRERVRNVSATGGRRYNPGWHLALDLRNMLIVSECTAIAALEREESRGGHTREDFPKMDPQWRKVNLVNAVDGNGTVTLSHKPVPTMRPDLLDLFDRSELAKYMTEEELSA